MLHRCWMVAFYGVIAHFVGCRPEIGPVSPITDYQRDILPLFRTHCFKCHGSDSAGLQGGLSLDSFEKATEVRNGRAAIVPRRPDQSELIIRVKKAGPGQMPPTGSLTVADIAKLEAWIAAGAPYQRHWAFSSPIRPSPPVAGHPIDAFVSEQLQRQGITAAPPATPHELIRRVHFDLTGLPPSPAQHAAFVADPTPAAYERVVDELLSSPASAEHFMRDWLDYAGYGDSNAIYLDTEREAWPYRDWVLSSFRQNQPFDSFIVEQLAGDLLPNANEGQQLATSFLRQHPTSEEGGADENEYRLKYAADRATQVSTQLLGLTTQCAQCHDHKYDPIPQVDFYRLADCFNRVGDAQAAGFATPLLRTRGPLERAHMSSWQQTLDEAQAWLQAIDLSAATNRIATQPVAWRPLTIAKATSAQGASVAQEVDGLIRVSGLVPLADTTILVGQVDQSVRALRLELGGGRRNTPILSEVTITEIGLAQQRTRVPIAIALLGQNQDADVVIDGATRTGLAIANPTILTLVPARAIEAGAGKRLEVRIDQYDGTESLFASYRISFSPDSAAALTDVSRAILLKGAAERTGTEAKRLQLEVALASGESTASALALQVLAASQALARREALPSVRVMRDDEPTRKTFVLKRGNFAEPLDEVRCGAPVALTLDATPTISNRLDLARWIVSRDQPTTARVLANHYFHFIFGRELLSTSGDADFGTSGGMPTHRNLLDWLAVELRDTWNLRAFIKLLVTSEAYKRSARPSEALRAADPDGLQLAYVWPKRLDGEVIRDQALQVSGLLNDQLGGRPSWVYHPDGLYETLGRGYSTLHVYRPDRAAPQQHRRSVYSFWRRGTALPSMLLLDVPSRTYPVYRRTETNTVTQALALLNEPVFVESARVLAERMLTEGGIDSQSQIRWAFQRVTQRPPTPSELSILTSLYEAEVLNASETPRDHQAPTVGESNTSGLADSAAHKAATAVARVVLNLSETLTRP